MTFDMIIYKIEELAIAFFNHTMTVGENRFMLVDANFISGRGLSEEEKIYFIASFLIMTLIAVFASDSFRILSPLEGISEWKSKIHILKVTIFAAAVFSIHTFYKMLITAIALVANDGIGSVMTNCLGSYINPISVCILSIAITTVELRHKWVQAFFLSLAVFVTPAVLTYSSITNEHIAIYAVGIALSIVAGILYHRFSMFVTYAIMSLTYLLGKFFLIYYSDQARIIDGRSAMENVGQYLSCMRIDIAMIFAFLGVLFIYNATSSKMSRKSIIRYCVVMGCLFITFVLSYPIRNLYPIKPVVYARESYNSIFDKKETVKQVPNEAIEDEPNYIEENAVIVNAYASSHLVTSSGSEYDIGFTFDGSQETCWQDGVSGDGIAETLTYEFENSLISGISVVNGNRRNDTSYEKNNRLATAILHFYDGNTEVYSTDITFDDNGSAVSEFYFGDGIQCNKIEIEITDVYHGSKYKDTCISEIGFTRLVEE